VRATPVPSAKTAARARRTRGACLAGVARNASLSAERQKGHVASLTRRWRAQQGQAARCDWLKAESPPLTQCMREASVPDRENAGESAGGRATMRHGVAARSCTQFDGREIGNTLNRRAIQSAALAQLETVREHLRPVETIRAAESARTDSELERGILDAPTLGAADVASALTARLRLASLRRSLARV